jgi:hypothetical protein
MYDESTFLAATISCIIQTGKAPEPIAGSQIFTSESFLSINSAFSLIEKGILKEYSLVSLPNFNIFKSLSIAVEPFLTKNSISLTGICSSYFYVVIFACFSSILKMESWSTGPLSIGT